MLMTAGLAGTVLRPAWRRRQQSGWQQERGHPPAAVQCAYSCGSTAEPAHTGFPRFRVGCLWRGRIVRGWLDSLNTALPMRRTMLGDGVLPIAGSASEHVAQGQPMAHGHILAGTDCVRQACERSVWKSNADHPATLACGLVRSERIFLKGGRKLTAAIGFTVTRRCRLNVFEVRPQPGPLKGAPLPVSAICRRPQVRMTAGWQVPGSCTRCCR